MGFGDLKTDSGVKSLNEFLADKSFIEGYQPSQADFVVFQAVSGAPGDDFCNALRWYNNIKSYTSSEQSSFSGQKKDVGSYGPAGIAAADEDDDDDDDIDLFGSDDDDEEEAQRLKEERLAQYADKKSTKPTIIAKSIITLDVKPWSDETPMDKVEECVRSVQTEGLVWGASKLIPVGYGIKKLQIACVVVDDLVGTDFLEEEITQFEDYIQSVDVAGFNKV